MERLELLIISLLNAGKTAAPLTRDALPALLADYAQEQETVRLRMMEDVFSAADENALLLVIDRYQAVFIRLMDQLHEYRRSLKRLDEAQPAAQALFGHLNELLGFLQVHYSRYFNTRQKMPVIKTEHFIKELQPQIANLTGALQRAALPQNRTTPLLRSLEDAVAVSTSYAESLYIKTVTTELLALDTTAPETAINSLLRSLLVSLDFNAPEICAYYTMTLDLLVSEEESVQGKLRLLKLQAKEINQAPVRPGFILYPGLPSLREQLTNWLSEELHFYTIEQAIAAALPAGAAPESKIHTSLSVPQLALLFRLLKEEQFITNPNQSELLKTVAAHFTTLHKESFSYGHLHGKYYKIDAATKRSLYDILMRLLHLSRKIG